jgi:pimeloyl-ACP methyl ester carboxylesterase
MLYPLLILAIPLIAAAERFASPSGPYRVGITQHIFNHSTPNDPVAPANASSILLATIYYPTLSIPLPNSTAEYLDATTANVWGTGLQFPNGSVESMKTWNQWQAPFLEDGTSQLPTVIFSPGGGANAIVYNFLSSELASQGYTVVGLDHPGEVPYLNLPDGKGGIYGVGITAEWNRTQLTALYHMRVSDALAVVQDLYKPYVESVSAPFNTTHFLMVGHSIGGAAAAGCMAVEPSILGGVNLDGGFFDMPDVKKPYLMMSAADHTPALDPTWSPFSMNQTGPWEWVNVTDTAHLSFTDLGDVVDLHGLRGQTLISPRLGTIWSPRINRIVNEYVLRLFDLALGGSQDALSRPDRAFPEVVHINGSSKAA